MRPRQKRSSTRSPVLEAAPSPSRLTSPTLKTSSNSSRRPSRPSGKSTSSSTTRVSCHFHPLPRATLKHSTRSSPPTSAEPSSSSRRQRSTSPREAVSSPSRAVSSLEDSPPTAPTSPPKQVSKGSSLSS